MNNLEFITLVIEFDKKKKDWVVQYTDETHVIGLEKILNTYGAQGWELVNMQAECFQEYPGFGKWSAEPTCYRATFKRHIES
jgi:hypothetical protein